MNSASGAPSALDGESPKVASELLPLAYEELRKLAAHKLANEAGGQPLPPPAFVHEAWPRWAGNAHPQWHNRALSLAAAADAMRHISLTMPAAKTAFGTHP